MIKNSLIIGLKSVLLTSLMVSQVWAASAKQTIEQLAVQVQPLWQSMAPVCVLALPLEQQQSVALRLDYLQAQLTAQNLVLNLENTAARDAHRAWSNQTWGLRQQFERDALAPEQREHLREYYFKLQTQKPNQQRANMVAKIQHMSQQLNLALREGLWKTCYALAFNPNNAEQLDTWLEERWSLQRAKVETHVSKELAAFYFYALRQVQNPELKVMADTAVQLDAWSEKAALAVLDYFTALRQQMLLVPLQEAAALPEQSYGSDRLKGQPLQPSSFPNNGNPQGLPWQNPSLSNPQETTRALP